MVNQEATGIRRNAGAPLALMRGEMALTLPSVPGKEARRSRVFFAPLDLTHDEHRVASA